MSIGGMRRGRPSKTTACLALSDGPTTAAARAAAGCRARGPLCSCMRCPRDSTDLRTQTYEASVEVDQCPQCSGLFLNKGELETLQASIDTDERKASVDALEISRAPVDAQDTSAIITCPQCSATMDRRRYGFGSQVMIDECPEGCGIWLDGGELGPVRMSCGSRSPGASGRRCAARSARPEQRLRSSEHAHDREPE